MWDIPLFDVTLDTTEIDAVSDVLKSGWLTMGGLTSKFEETFAERVGVRHAVAVSNCSSALYLSLLALGVGKGDEVICPSLTFVAGANVTVRSGATPVFADIGGEGNLNVTADTIRERITPRTRAIQIVHFAGIPCDMDGINAVAEEYGIPVIEDCAHALGASLNGRACGSMAATGCFSFFSNKNITTAEGGMITTDDEAVADRLRLLRSHGMTTVTIDRHEGRSLSYDVHEFGLNCRIDELRAAMGLVQLGRLDGINARRGELCRLYSERLADSPWVELPFRGAPGQSGHHIYPVLLADADSRRDVMEHMKANRIQTSIHYPASHLFKVYREQYGYGPGDLPRTEDATARELTLPLYPAMRDEDVLRVCDTLEAYYENTRKSA